MNTSKKVCAVIVTYNRKEYLKKVLEGLRRQTYPLSAVLLYDNSSSDGTDEMLIEMGFVDNIIEENLHVKKVSNIEWMYYRSSVNRGGSGGFHGGIKLASGKNYDYLWTMDDDVLPSENCLEKLIFHMSNEVRLCIPSRTDENYLDYAITNIDESNPFLYTLKMRKTKIPSAEIKGDTIEIHDMPFEGPLIAISLINEIGFPKEDLFLNFDDTEYALRASRKTKLLYCKNATLHKQIIPVHDKNHLMDWKNYYNYRNQIWFDKTYGTNFFVRTLRPVLLVLDLCGRAIVRRKWSNFKVLYRAYMDGTTGELGKLVEPGTPGNKF